MDNICPACEKVGILKYPEKIEIDKITELTYASRKLPELMHYDLFECLNCETLFTNREINVKELISKYQKAEYDSNIEAKFAARTYVENIINALPNFKGSVLDIGAGDGSFLMEAKKNFATRILGIEPSTVAISYNTDSGIEILNTSIESFVSDEKFDLITCFQTIEHLNKPDLFLEKLKKHLSQNGYIAITCHNRNSLVNKLLKEKSPIFDIEHLQVFTKKGIENLFKKVNLNIIFSKSYKNTYPLNYWLKLFPIPSKIKSLLLNFKVFRIQIPINVGNHLIIGKIK